MPTPRFAPRVAMQAPPPGTAAPGTSSRQTITEEIIQVRGNQYLVQGTPTPTRLPGMSLNDGDVVHVLWERAFPKVILDVVIKFGAGSDEGGAAEGIVEELFIAKVDGVVDVFFRNEKQITNLTNRAVEDKLPGDPIAVRWGANERSFVVQCGDPGPVDFWPQYFDFIGGFHLHTPSRPPQTQTYHVFTMRGSDKRILGSSKPSSVTLVASYQPSTSPLEAIAADGHFVGDAAVTAVAVNAETATFFGQASSSTTTSGTGGGVAYSISDLLAQTVGPCEIVDFGLDRKNHLLVFLRARPEVSVLVPVATAGNRLQIHVPSNCTWDTLPVSGGGFQFIGVNQGEGHAWVFDATDSKFLFRTNDAVTTRLVLAGFESGTFDTSGTITKAIVTEACGFSDLWQPNHLAAHTGDEKALGHLGGNGSAEQKLDLWDEARFSFIAPGSLDQIGTLVWNDKTAYFPTAGPGDFDVKLTWSEPGATFSDPHPAWAYYVRKAFVLRGPQTAKVPPYIFLSLYRSSTKTFPSTMQYAAFVVKADGTLVATLKDWATVQTFPLPEFNGDPVPPFGYEVSDQQVAEAHDGSEVALISGNWEHVLWTFSTKDERAAGTRHVRLTQLSTGQTAAVGDSWARTTPHDFRVLNLDVMYKAKPEDKSDAEPKGRYFVKAWDFKTGEPTLSQDDPKYPPEEKKLVKNKALKDLNVNKDKPYVPTFEEYQAVNDAAALGGVKLQPKPGDAQP